MVPWVKLGSAKAPGGAEISLWQRGDELVVRAGAIDLMSNRVHGSEELLAEHGCAGLGAGARVLVGGLGMGFTLRAALSVLPARSRVLVAEIVPAMVEWVRGPIGGAKLLADPRVAVEERDVGEILRESEARFDAILLDVDNGPSALAHGGNRRLYGAEGIAAAARALRPGGRLAVWSAGEDPAFEKRLARAGLDAKTIRVRARKTAAGEGRGAKQAIFLGVRR
jgi:spermidine synthase